MNKIGFENFRRFKNFEPLYFRGITFLVGRNNAGKSTLVKAMLLIDNYFKSGSTSIFSFGNNVLEDANIVTYGRAKYSKAEKNEITLTQDFENFTVDFVLSGEDDKAFANVNTLKITENSNKYYVIYNFPTLTVTYGKAAETGAIEDEIPKMLLETNLKIKDLNKEIKISKLKKTSEGYIELISKLQTLKNSKGFYQAMSSDEGKAMRAIKFNLEEHFNSVHSLQKILSEAVKQSISDYALEHRAIQGGKTETPRFADLKALKDFNPNFIDTVFDGFNSIVKSDPSLIYLPANGTKQSALFSIRDKNNALAQAIHDYTQLNILKGERENRFVTKWMQVFEIGDDFEIKMFGGEAYQMLVSSNNTKIHLADKGMGSIQAMLLIMRIACAIRKVNDALKDEDKRSLIMTDYDSGRYELNHAPMLIIEEPELNLHPALQSKLADLFFEVNQEYKIEFLVETHSEYLIRRSQVLVAQKELEVHPNTNPFFTYYFPKEINQKPYSLKYQADGSFDKNFGQGFFDEASASTLELLKLKRQNQA